MSRHSEGEVTVSFQSSELYKSPHLDRVHRARSYDSGGAGRKEIDLTYHWGQTYLTGLTDTDSVRVVVWQKKQRPGLL